MGTLDPEDLKRRKLEHRILTMKLLVACVFGGVALMSTLLFDSTNAQTDCLPSQIEQWGAATLSERCLADNTISWETEPGVLALNRACTDDSCAGAIYRYLLANCSAQQAYLQQTRCAAYGSLRCFYGEFPMPYPEWFNSTAFTDLQSTCNLTNATNPCPDGCAEALMTIRDDIGCCFNNIYNVTGNHFQQFASNELWAACQVPTLGRCTETLNPNAPTTMMPTTAGSDAIAASLVVLLILTTTNVVFVL